jgi:ring-1,2-phenylacetyl-CoA epoxidase subunit PaaE
VEMDVNYALEADELAAGFILTCQSHPRSPKVVIDFDSK